MCVVRSMNRFHWRFDPSHGFPLFSAGGGPITRCGGLGAAEVVSKSPRILLRVLSEYLVVGVLTEICHSWCLGIL